MSAGKACTPSATPDAAKTRSPPRPARRQAKHVAPQHPQARRIELQPMRNSISTTPEFREVQDALHVGDQAQSERPDSDASCEDSRNTRSMQRVPRTQLAKQGRRGRPTTGSATDAEDMGEHYQETRPAGRACGGRGDAHGVNRGRPGCSGGLETGAIKFAARRRSAPWAGLLNVSRLAGRPRTSDRSPAALAADRITPCPSPNFHPAVLFPALPRSGAGLPLLRRGTAAHSIRER